MKPLRPLYLALYYPVMLLAQLLVRLVFPIKTYGHKNLPRGGYVLAPNHVNAIDPLFVVLARGLRPKMIVMGKAELFRINGLLNFFWNMAGVFPVERGAGNRQVVDDAVQAVRDGRSLLIFPEGTRGAEGQMGRLKSGAFVVAQEAGAPMVPCVVWYAAGKPKPFRRTFVAFGLPAGLDELGLDGPHSAKKLRGAKTLFAERLQVLRKEHKP